MASHAIRIVKCTKYHHETCKPSVRPYIGGFVVLYFNDILIYNKNVQGHCDHLTHVMNGP